MAAQRPLRRADTGELVTRYDKRLVSHTEKTRFYTVGSDPVVVEVDGFRLGFVICVEINFPGLLAEYADLGVDAVLVSAGFAPDGAVLGEVVADLDGQGLVVVDLDRDDPSLETALTRARPWRTAVADDPSYRCGAPDDRSTDRTRR